MAASLGRIPKSTHTYEVTESTRSSPLSLYKNRSRHTGCPLSRCELLITFISLIFFRSPCFGLDTDSIKIIPALNKELISQQEKLFHQLKTTWQQVVLFSSQDVSKGKKTTNSITIRGVSQPGESKERISELLQALNHMELLDDLLVPFVAQLKTNFISVFFSQSCRCEVTAETLTLTFSKLPEPESGLQPAVVFTKLKELVAFLQERLDVPLSGAEGAETLLQRLSASLSTWLCDTLIR